MEEISLGAITCPHQALAQTDPQGIPTLPVPHNQGKQPFAKQSPGLSVLPRRLVIQDQGNNRLDDDGIHERVHPVPLVHQTKQPTQTSAVTLMQTRPRFREDWRRIAKRKERFRGHVTPPGSVSGGHERVERLLLPPEPAVQRLVGAIRLR